MDFVILAAGAGSRLLREGLAQSKPMADISGTPMIGRLIDTIKAVGASRIIVVANPRMTDLIDYLTLRSENDKTLNIRPAITENSFHSLLCGAKGLRGRFGVITVDSVLIPSEIEGFVAQAKAEQPRTALMGLTHTIDDPTPLYAYLTESGRIVDYAHTAQNPFPCPAIISAGIYALTPDLIASVKDNNPTSLSHFQQLLALNPENRVIPYIFTECIDVDDIHNLNQARRFYATH